jgi:transmembrane sensor
MDKKDDTFLARWLEDDLSPDELHALENSTEYPTLLNIRQNFTRLQPPRTNDGAILAEVLRHDKIRKRKVFQLYKKTAFAVAAMLIVLLGVGYYLTLPKNLAAPNGQTYAFALPDASEVLLNSGSDASYRSWNWDSNREIALHGEAYFKVAKGQKFTVETKLGTVTVLGTQFNVRARDNRFEVTCYEGKVRVWSPSGKQILLPGQRIIFGSGISAEVIATKSTSPEWTRHELLFENETYAAVLAELERKYNVKIESSLQTRQLFSGSIPDNDLDSALKIVAVTYHLDIQKSAGIIVLNPIK